MLPLVAEFVFYNLLIMAIIFLNENINNKLRFLLTIKRILRRSLSFTSIFVFSRLNKIFLFSFRSYIKLVSSSLALSIKNCLKALISYISCYKSIISYLESLKFSLYYVSTGIISFKRLFDFSNPRFSYGFISNVYCLDLNFPGFSDNSATKTSLSRASYFNFLSIYSHSL